MITLTDQAADQIKKIFENEYKKTLAFRISVKGGGCSGFKYDFAIIDTDWTDADEYILVESQGVKVAIDTLSAVYLDGSTLDYKKKLFSSEFVVKNPKSKNTCGCGQSFN